jgi:hypothetical protein
MVLTINMIGYHPLGAAEEGKNIDLMIKTAKTPADHEAIAAFYQEESARLKKESEQHAGLAEQLTSEAGGQSPSASHHYEQAEHCRKFADALGKAAQEAQGLADVHKKIAQTVEKPDK